MQEQFFICKAYSSNVVDMYIQLCSSKTYQNFLATVLFLQKLSTKRILNRQIDKFDVCGLRKFLERGYHEAEIQKEKKIKTGAFLEKNRLTNIKKIYRRTM